MNGGACARVMSRAALETLIGDAQRDLTALHHVAEVAQQLTLANEGEIDSPEFVALAKRFAPDERIDSPTIRLAISQQVRKTLGEAVRAAAL